MDVPAILEALEDCPGLIAHYLTDDRGHYCVLGWLMLKASKTMNLTTDSYDQMLDSFGLGPYGDVCRSLVDFNNRHYRSRKARLEAVRGYVAAQAAAQDGGR